MAKKELDLPWNEYRGFTINEEYLKPYIYELLKTLDGNDYMNSLDFAKKTMFTGEIKSNNMVEGIFDDLEFIEEVIKSFPTSDQKRKRVLNLYYGYQYILTHFDINKESLKELYEILSDGILTEYDKENLGEYYRTKPVYIRKGRRIDAYSMGLDSNHIDYAMDKLIEYINNGEDKVSIDSFIKSQIVHFYFVNVHPYFDVNGRTSRTLAMWYLLNNESYSYIIFNRAIASTSRDYEYKIENARKRGEVTLFIKYMLESVMLEVEKENIIHIIEKNLSTSLNIKEHQTLEYILSMRGNITFLDLVYFYNQKNEKRSALYILNNYIKPLIDKEILILGSMTNKKIDNQTSNFFLKINPEFFTEKEKVKHLELGKYTK